MTAVSKPRNPLAGRSGYTHLLRQELADHEVAEFCRYGSCRWERFHEHGDGFCPSYKAFFARIDPVMTAMSHLLRNGRPPSEYAESNFSA